MSKSVMPMLSSNSFITSGLKLKSLIHFEFTFVYGVRSNQSILKEISPGISLEGMMLKAETPVLWPPHAKS